MAEAESAPEQAEPDHSRIVVLEEQVAFQQRQLEQLNGVVLEQQASLDVLRADFRALRAEIEQLRESSEGDLPQEKPPHY